ncbi:hypothetical protein PP634_gp44 [Arthrobacter phage Richie]|jgi:hypothetical protein|uniref:Uncharacterized protein n=2 Tax=Caudoviricetes TaxID=2731619 RepID=A0A3G2KFX9_9CAUD|nr:hypothetical protein PP634_gp44 [Arthrobacter phage Richie]YP_010656327.1 hypothetical protein PP640_gp41 [Arthrobacter phage Faja]AYN57893.1 hypothetical protein PBI_FAJA_41 [Arthrobacter phage Faja]AYN58870.1 hypothetical protein PBI_RICHIE_44 [Arthrobacter phage Richie]
MSARTEAASDALYEHTGDGSECCVEAVLEASDAVMFGEANIERIARARYMAQRDNGDQWVWEDRSESLKERWRQPIRATIHDLKAGCDE